MFKLSNVTKDKHSTLVGLAIVACALASKFTTDTSWTDIIPALLLGIGLMGIDTTKIRGNND